MKPRYLKVRMSDWPRPEFYLSVEDETLAEDWFVSLALLWMEADADHSEPTVEAITEQDFRDNAIMPSINTEFGKVHPSWGMVDRGPWMLPDEYVVRALAEQERIDLENIQKYETT